MSVIELEARNVAIETAPSGLWSDAWYRLRRNPGAIAGFVIIACVVVVAIFAPLVAAVWVAFDAYEIIWWREARARTRALRLPASVS
jgi:ABC-type antimicrobial peptide transport system permease subunit